MRGFGSFTAAARFRAATRSGERVALAERRRRFQERWAAVMAELAAA